MGCKVLRTIIAAFQFLSSIPIKSKDELKPDILGKSVALFPLVGLVFGLILVLCDWVLSFVFPKMVIDIFIIIILISLNGGLHLDGFIDTCDGLLGGRGDKERILAIMKDSNVGAHGITCAICLMLLKFTLLYGLFGKLRLFVLVMMPLLARWSVVLAIVFFPYTRSEGAGKIFSSFSGIREFFVATIFTLLAIFWLPSAAFALIGVFLFTVIFAKQVTSKIGGLTGDTYGALIEINEIIVLMIFLVGGDLW